LNRRVPTHELVVADAALRGREGRWQIGVDDGRQHVVASGRLVASSTSTTTFHLDQGANA
jgi:cytosine deaminase